MRGAYCPDAGDIVDITFDPQKGASNAAGGPRLS